MAWHYPTAAGPAPLGVAPEAVTDEARAQMAESLSKVVAEGAAGLDVEEEIAYGHPAQVLIEQSADAGLLVVGNRGHGAFTGMLLGSVSIHCVTHSHCPVVVVRTDA
jgi:nucleotide-binding universal stress UspA family protein